MVMERLNETIQDYLHLYRRIYFKWPVPSSCSDAGQNGEQGSILAPLAVSALRGHFYTGCEIDRPAGCMMGRFLEREGDR